MVKVDGEDGKKRWHKPIGDDPINFKDWLRDIKEF